MALPTSRESRVSSRALASLPCTTSIVRALAVVALLATSAIAVAVAASAQPILGDSRPASSPPTTELTPTPSDAEAAQYDFPPVQDRIEAVRSSRGGVRPSVQAAKPASPQEMFIQAAAAAAETSQEATGVPASVTIAQAILESSWGKNTLGANNYFGIKADEGAGSAGVVWVNTQEYLNGAWVTIQAPFKAYNSMAESFTDHDRFLMENSRYAPAFQHNDDPKEFARAIHRAGYATAPNYSDILISIMDTYDLYRFDLNNN